jgi:hypothetical protein
MPPTVRVAIFISPRAVAGRITTDDDASGAQRRRCQPTRSLTGPAPTPRPGQGTADQGAARVVGAPWARTRQETPTSLDTG